MKFILTVFVLLILFISENLTLDAVNYTSYIEELSHDEKFLEEYTKWSLELFSDPNYLYGKPHKQFPCPVEKINNNGTSPTSVHSLRPTDVKCIGAIGDSLTTGLGAHAITPIGLLLENRGISWSIGGDYTYLKMLSLPNILRQYNPKLEGFSTKVSLMSLNDTHNRLNVAKSGDHSIDMPYQAELLIDRLKTEKICDWNNDWKLITFFVGGNDLCTFCEDSNITKHAPEQYMIYVRDTLDKLYNSSIPRTFVNLVLIRDIRGVKDLNTGGYICQELHKKTCPCAASPTEEQAKILDDYIPRYHKVLLDLIDSGRYEGRDDFTVVIQPFMAKTRIPHKNNHKIDFSYFAPDCLHFSGKGHSQAALSLWNNMLEPVGGKQWTWHMGESLKCPTKEYPYIFTSKNSAKALNEIKPTIMTLTTRRVSTMSSSTASFDINITMTQSTNLASTVSNSTASFNDNTNTTRHRKHKESNSNSSFNKMKFVVLVGFLFIIVIILIVGISRRRKIRVVLTNTGRRPQFQNLNNSEYVDENEEVEVWSRPNSKSDYSDNIDVPKTHGERMFFA